MLRRDAGQDWLLITQHDHAVLSGRLGAHIGNAVFARPEPRDAVLAAFSLHDAGWPLHDDRPTLNPQGIPCHVFEATIDSAMAVWPASADRAAESAGPYAALLVSLHVLGLSTMIAQHLQTAKLTVPERNQLQFRLNKFQHHEIERQENLRRKLGLSTDLPLHLGLAAPGSGPDEDNLRVNFRLLQAVDRISLTLCCTGLLFPQIEEIPPRPGAAPLTLHLRHDPGGALAITPWLFDAPTLSFKIPARRLAKNSFSSEQQFQSAYAAASSEELPVALAEPPP